MLFLWGAVNFFRKKIEIERKQKLLLVVLVIICAIPLALNYYTPEWNKLLKQTPIIKNSVVLVRWYVIYIPLVVVIAAVVINKLKYNRYLVPGMLLMLLLIKGYEDKSYYSEQSYDPQLSVYAHQQVMETKIVPPIEKISDVSSINTPENVTMAAGDAVMAFGLSQINCHESLFGYRHEEFKQKKLLQISQSVMEVKNGHFNMKNPACYVFPDENSCIPGDHFRADQKEDLLNFIGYKGYEFNMPKTQHISNWISLITILMCGGFLVVPWLQALFASYRRKS